MSLRGHLPLWSLIKSHAGSLHDRNIFNFEGVSPFAIIEAENGASTAAKLAVNLLTALFSHEELSTGNCTKANRADIKVLDPEKIHAIRSKYLDKSKTFDHGKYFVAYINIKYPLSKEEEGRRWTEIRTKNLNAKCRSYRQKLEKL